jgi:hypothetical protein
MTEDRLTERAARLHPGSQLRRRGRHHPATAACALANIAVAAPPPVPAGT